MIIKGHAADSCMPAQAKCGSATWFLPKLRAWGKLINAAWGGSGPSLRSGRRKKKKKNQGRGQRPDVPMLVMVSEICCGADGATLRLGAMLAGVGARSAYSVHDQ